MTNYWYNFTLHYDTYTETVIVFLPVNCHSSSSCSHE